MQGKTILVLATLDSKGEAVRVLCERIRELGHEPMTLDLSIMNPLPFARASRSASPKSFFPVPLAWGGVIL